MNEMREKFIFVGGKGGVGKSTCAAAIASKFANEGYKTLLVSTDPAHNLADLFAQPIGGKITMLMDNLYGLEIDPEIETRNYINEAKNNIKTLVQTEMLEEVFRHLDAASASPGADEAAMFDALTSIILEQGPNYQKLIFDTAPTGHTIRLLALPELMGVWINGLLERRRKTNENYSQFLHDGEPIEDPIYDVLIKRQESFSAVRTILLDSNRSGFIFVLNPENLPILETNKAIAMLEKYDIHVSTLIVNKILPTIVDGEFLRQRKQYEKHYLDEITSIFTKQHIIYLPLLAHDILNPEDLQQISKYL